MVDAMSMLVFDRLRNDCSVSDVPRVLLFDKTFVAVLDGVVAVAIKDVLECEARVIRFWPDSGSLAVVSEGVVLLGVAGCSCCCCDWTSL